MMQQGYNAIVTEVQVIQVMQRGYNTVIAERDSLRQELADVNAELQKALDELNGKEERRIWWHSVDQGFCDKRRCRYVHQYGDRPVQS